MQRNLSRTLDHAAGAVRIGFAAARNRDFDTETGLRTRAHLQADMARLHGIPARLELLALQAGDGLGDDLLAATETGLPRRLGDALRAAAEAQGARAYRLDGTLYAFLGPVEGSALTPAASAQRALAGIAASLAAGAVRGEARIPDEATDGVAALAIAHERLRARSRGSDCRPSARSATCCSRSSPSGARAARPSRRRASPRTRSASVAASASR